MCANVTIKNVLKSHRVFDVVFDAVVHVMTFNLIWLIQMYNL